MYNLCQWLLFACFTYIKFTLIIIICFFTYIKFTFIMTSQYEWKILEWDVKPLANKQTLINSSPSR